MWLLALINFAENGVRADQNKRARWVRSLLVELGLLPAFRRDVDIANDALLWSAALREGATPMEALEAVAKYRNVSLPTARQRVRRGFAALGKDPPAVIPQID
jgi:hypothetical protein